MTEVQFLVRLEDDGSMVMDPAPDDPRIVGWMRRHGKSILIARESEMPEPRPVWMPGVKDVESR